MISDLNSKLNDFLDGERISKENFTELKNVAELTNFNKKILYPKISLIA
jgi:hypothetical protein